MIPNLLPGQVARKWRKYSRDPNGFFEDARSPLVRATGKWWLRVTKRTGKNACNGHYSGLADFLGEGAAIGRTPASKPKAPPEDAWRTLFNSISPSTRNDPIVDVIIPVFRGYDDTLACIYSVLSAPVRTRFELTVIDDNSPEAKLSAELQRLAGMGLFTLHRNEENLGFVATANKGASLHNDRDVVLLNSDAVVYGNWLDRLRRHAREGRDVATVTPLSNNATICSYPRSDWNNRYQLELEYEELDSVVAQVNEGLSVDVPTGVGFCMYIRRKCLEEIGLFDEERFGRGYGEENDFCVRATEHGWRHLAACDIFVRHTGEVSFATDAAKNRKRALATLFKRHPEYDGRIQKFIADDPLARHRQRIDAERLVRHTGGKSVLYVTHARGGGIERHVRDMATLLSHEGVSVITLRPTRRNEGQISLNALDPVVLPNLNPLDLADLDEIAEVLVRAGVYRIHVHSFADYPSDMIDWVSRLAERLAVDYDFTVHDYLAVCPQINLIDRSGSYCGEKGEDACTTCIARNGTPFGKPDIRQWRGGYERFLAGARDVYTPSADTARRMSRYFPGLNYKVRPHPEPAPGPARSLAAPRADAEPVRVAVIGAIGPHKGSAVLKACARDAAKRKLPLEFVVIGTVDNRSALLRLPNVTITGEYQEDEVFDLIERNRCHLAFLPSVWPETYCYTLSIALAAGLPPVVFDIGAPAERLRESGGRASILPLEAIDDAAALNHALLSLGSGEAGRRIEQDLRRISAVS